MIALGSGHALQRRLDAACAGGYAWLAERFTVSACPGVPFHWADYRIMYLANLGRAYETGSVASTQGRDWYFEGAMMLLGLQYRNAKGWGTVEESAQGLMFLRPRANGPVTPPRKGLRKH